MTTKLTLSVEKSVISKARKYARKRNVSLSRLVENYFSSLAAEEKSPENVPLSPITAELAGLAGGIDITDEKSVLSDALIDKYL